MKRLFVTGILCFGLFAGLYGQKLRYGGLQQLSVGFNDQGLSAGLAVSNGVRFHRFYTGVGADAAFGRNFLFWGGVPNASALYADGRYYINEKKNFFAKVNGGVNLITQGMEDSEWQKFKKYPGYYGAAGFGLKAKLSDEVFYSFDISYGIKQVRYDYSYRNFQSEWQTDEFNIRRPMIMVNMGIEIF